MTLRRIFYQIFISFFIIIILALITVTWYSRDLAKNFYLSNTSDNLKDLAKVVAAQIEEDLSLQQYARIKRKMNNLGQVSETRITVILPNGKVLADTDEDPGVMDNHINRPEVQQALEDGEGSSIRFSNTIEIHLMYKALKMQSSDGETLAIVRTALPIEDIETTLEIIQNRILTAGLIVAIITALLGWFTSRRISKPLELMTKGIQHFGEGKLDTRLPNVKNHEVNQLAEALNEMAGQLNEKIKTIELQKSELKTILDSMAEGVLAVNCEEKVIMINAAARQLLGIDGKHVHDRYIQEVSRNTQLQNIINRTLQSGKFIEDEIIMRRTEIRYVQTHGTRLNSEMGQTIGALIVMNDVTRLRRLEQVRRDFVANVSHEIRTPLTSIKGFVETLYDGAIEHPETARKFLDIITRQANRLNAIIDDLMALANLEQDEERAAIQFEIKAVKDVMDSAVEICQPSASQKNIHLTIECDGQLSVSMNPMLLEQALVNLIENAVKYSPNGTHIKLACDTDAQWAHLTVQDEGIGIPKEHIARIFERFYRVDKARSRKLGGTGLGLAIVKHIVKLHNGKLSVDSLVGKGSTFNMYLPLS
ncbi:MAG: HAMP domain-containing protein [Caldithrix sp.]|nr:HAMP domain-containing protein [Caldithrix sp.]